jgi:hypothetical protein
VLANKSSPHSPTTMPTTTAHPTPKTPTEPDATLPATPAAALVAMEEWRIATGKVTRRKAKEPRRKRTGGRHRAPKPRIKRMVDGARKPTN